MQHGVLAYVTFACVALVGLTTARAQTTEAAATESEAPSLRGSAALLFGVSSGNLGFGLGARGGVTFLGSAYAGATLVYHFGSSASYGAASANVSALQAGVEGGYAFRFDPVIVRPFGGLGALTYFNTVLAAGSTASSTVTDFAFWVGGTVAYRIPDTNFSVGGDLRLLVPLGYGVASFGAFLMGSVTI